LESIGTDDVRVDVITYPVVVVLTQDCDLSQDATARALETEAAQNPSRLDDPEFKKNLDRALKWKIGSVICCEVKSTAELKPIAAQQKELWKRVIQNFDPRFHCLEAVPTDQDAAGQGIPSVGCDFKHFFTVSIDDVYKRIQLGQVVARTYLVQPYAEHLLQRFYNFQARIPLPENHHVEI